MDISISCNTHGCRNNICSNDNAFCEDCMNSALAEGKEKDTQIENRDEEISNLETELEQAKHTIEQLRDIIKSCTTCSAILVAKNL